MIKQFLVPCDFNGVTTQVPFYIGNPAKDNNPVQHQAHWLSSTRGGVVSQEVMDSLKKLNEIASRNNILVVDLCEYALMSAFPKKEPVLAKEQKVKQVSAPISEVQDVEHPASEVSDQESYEEVQQYEHGAGESK